MPSSVGTAAHAVGNEVMDTVDPGTSICSKETVRLMSPPLRPPRPQRKGINPMDRTRKRLPIHCVI